MGLRQFWNRLMGGDKVERVEEELQEDRTEDPEPSADYEAGKDDIAVDERFRGTTSFEDDR